MGGGGVGGGKAGHKLTQLCNDKPPLPPSLPLPPSPPFLLSRLPYLLDCHHAREFPPPTPPTPRCFARGFPQKAREWGHEGGNMKGGYPPPVFCSIAVQGVSRGRGQPMGVV